MTRGRQAVAAVALLLLAGCGGTTPAQVLSDRVDAVVRSADAGRPDEVRRSVDALVRTVEEQRAAGQVGDARARRLLALAAQVRADAGLLTGASPSPGTRPSAAPSPTAAPSPSPSPTARPLPSPREPAPPGKGKGKGRGKDGEGKGGD